MEIIESIKSNTPFTKEIVTRISSEMKGNTFHHHYHILYTLRSFINKEIATYTEIGTFNGGSLCLMLQHPLPVYCISIDPFHLDRTNVQHTIDNITMFNKNNYKVYLTKKFSTDQTLLEEFHSTNFKTDILFIDGDHSYDAVLHDFNKYNEFVSTGGFIVFDDYHDSIYSPEVKPAVDYIVKNIIENHLPFEIIGSPLNFDNVYPSTLPYLNEFIIRKLGSN